MQQRFKQANAQKTFAIAVRLRKCFLAEAQVTTFIINLYQDELS